ncbi:twin-arginine translocase TatA/TatE family subunit [Pontibacter sp. SGAir0037]|uniref:Sec-independent protein translocase subunit TatA/TatB n=1 Tax=Pontibacter sp. SGAir0037 TaxID=2571030 RepID=UPI0010CCD26D|nr:twin-arginine translocase TatA/TatE family subunit [Pontibacter sp. SGAir0037]QCR24667.1 twin-arginine translocase TatA/TatE family subunit [Pontibacter sp. SGAir0037]
MMIIQLFAFIGGLGGSEILVILFAVLLLFGAKRIPELARGLGRGIREFKDATKEIETEIKDAVKDKDKEGQ